MQEGEGGRQLRAGARSAARSVLTAAATRETRRATSAAVPAAVPGAAPPSCFRSVGKGPFAQCSGGEKRWKSYVEHTSHSHNCTL